MRAFVDQPARGDRYAQLEGRFSGPVGPFWTRRRRFVAVLVLVAVWLAGVAVASSRAERPSSTSRARAACPPQHVAKCRKHLEHALAALEWQRKQRAVEAVKVLEKARGRQPFAYAAQLAELACISFTYVGNPKCRPPHEMIATGRCESGLQVHDPNPVSSADGWMQFLDSTWASTPAGAFGWSRYDVLAMAVATEARVLRDGGSWHEWVCGQS